MNSSNSRTLISDISASSDHRKTNYGLLDSSWWCASNCTIFISLTSIDKMVFAFYCLETFVNNFLSIDARDMKIVQSDAHHHDEFNKP